MADWLDELEDKKRQEQKATIAAWERDKIAAQKRQAEYTALYERNKDAIAKVFDEMASYASRAKAVTDTKLSWTTYKGRFDIVRGADYELKIHEDEIPWKNRYLRIDVTTDGFLVSTAPHDRDETGQFKIPIESVSTKHISCWVKWLVNGDSVVQYHKDLTILKIQKPRNTTNVIVGVVLLIITVLFVVFGLDWSKFP
jgi:hypothetical protein